MAIMVTVVELERQARVHAAFCPRCASAVVKYRDRVHPPWSTVPPDVATAIRVICCKQGATILDQLLLGGAR